MGPDMSESPWQPIPQPPRLTHTHIHSTLLRSRCVMFASLLRLNLRQAQNIYKKGLAFLFHALKSRLTLFSHYTLSFSFASSCILSSPSIPLLSPCLSHSAFCFSLVTQASVPLIKIPAFFFSMHCICVVSVCL